MPATVSVTQHVFLASWIYTLATGTNKQKKNNECMRALHHFFILFTSNLPDQ